jgi:hypothetical protein
VVRLPVLHCFLRTPIPTSSATPPPSVVPPIIIIIIITISSSSSYATPPPPPPPRAALSVRGLSCPAVPGRLLRIGDRNSAELWGKPLADRSFAAVMWYRNQTQAVRRRESKRLHSGAIELDFRDLGFQGLAEVVVRGTLPCFDHSTHVADPE